MTAPNDILIRLSYGEDGATSYETLILLNDEAILPEMEKLAAFLRQCLTVYGRNTDAGIEYHDALAIAESLAKPKGRILVSH